MTDDEISTNGGAALTTTKIIEAIGFVAMVIVAVYFVAVERIRRTIA
jgi:hypothetical protein